MSTNWYQNKLLIISILVVSFLAGAISYGMSTPRYALYTKQGQELLGSTLEKFSGSATSYLVSQKITGTGDTDVLLLEVPQNKMNLGLHQLEIELSRVSGTGWKVVGLSNSTIHALYENKKLSSPVSSIVSNQARISQCNQVIAIVNEAVINTRVIIGSGQTSDPALLEAADTMDAAATKLENISLTDQTLQDYRSGFSKMYREISQATRAFVEAFKNQDRPAAEAALTSLQQATTAVNKLTTGFSSYCAR